MKKLLPACTIAVLLFPTVSLAIDPPPDNGSDAVLAIYFDYDADTGDESGASDTITPVPLNTPINVYFVMYYPRVPSQTIGGVEFSWVQVPGNTQPFIIEATYPPGGVNLGDEHNVILRFAGPYDFAGVTHRMVVALTFLFPSSPWWEEVFLGPADPSGGHRKGCPGRHHRR